MRKRYHYEWGVFVHASLFNTYKDWIVAHAVENEYRAIGWKNIQVKKTRVYN